MQPNRDRVCLALDIHDDQQILQIVRETKDLVGYYKLNSAFVLYGRPLLEKIYNLGGSVFLDLKFKDIPNTVQNYGEVIARMGVSIATVHTFGGIEMLQSLIYGVKKRCESFGLALPKLIGITMLTSISQRVMNTELGIQGTVEEEVYRKASLATLAGLDGIVCSAQELKMLKPRLPKNLMYITPGVRPNSEVKDDQQRATTYAAAAEAGSDLLVVGRPILNAPDRRAALLQLHEDIAPWLDLKKTE